MSLPDKIKEVGIVAKFLGFLAQFFAGVTWVYQHLIWPITSRLIRFAKWVFWKYHFLVWDKAVYTKSGHFSRTRAGVVITVTAALIFFIPLFLSMVFQTTLFFTTQRYETVYLTNSQEIDPLDDIHSVRGCESLPCTEANSIYFRVQPGFIQHAWSLLDHGDVFYPDRTASVVAPGVNQCQVRSYGIRLKFLMRRWDVYPDMIDAVCQPLGGSSQ